MRLVGLKCLSCGEKDELLCSCDESEEMKKKQNGELVHAKCSKCGDQLVKWDFKSNPQCWSFGDTTMLGGGEND